MSEEDLEASVLPSHFVEVSIVSVTVLWSRSWSWLWSWLWPCRTAGITDGGHCIWLLVGLGDQTRAIELAWLEPFPTEPSSWPEHPCFTVSIL